MEKWLHGEKKWAKARQSPISANTKYCSPTSPIWSFSYKSLVCLSPSRLYVVTCNIHLSFELILLLHATLLGRSITSGIYNILGSSPQPKVYFHSFIQ